MSTLALIPARAGSKGIPGKNFRRLGDMPLWAHAVCCAWVSGPQSVIISSDAPEPRECGMDNIWLQRPADLAQDDTPMLAVVQHALQQIPGPSDQIIVLLQPTQPFRTAAHVQQAITLLRQHEAGCPAIADDESDYEHLDDAGMCVCQKPDSVVSVVELPRTHSPDMLVQIIDDGAVMPWMSDKELGYRHWPARRQDARPAYKRDGTVYAFYRKTVSEHGSIYGRRVVPLIIPADESCELDTEPDWAEVERRWQARELERGRV